MREVKCPELIPLRSYGIQEIRTREQACRSYACVYCRYESSRQFNVKRHEARIHSTTSRPRICCGKKFLSKGEFYLHCEKIHPNKRSSTSVSRTKYKILANMVRISRNNSLEEDKTEEDEYEYSQKVTYKKKKKLKKRLTRKKGRLTTVEENIKYKLHRRTSERIRQKRMERRMRAKLTFECSITYHDIDRDDIPLACFLHDRTSRKARNSSTSTVTSSTETTTSNDTMMTSVENPNTLRESISDTTTIQTNVEMNTTEMVTSMNPPWKEDFSWKEKEQNYSRNVAYNSNGSVLDSLDSSYRSTSNSESSSFSACELPTKKLILRRFFETMDIDMDNEKREQTRVMPLKKRNLNVYVSSQQMKKHTLNPTLVSCTDTVCSYVIMDKENVSNQEEKVKVRLDNNITLPVVTELHRDFLSSIDFDRL